MTGHGRRAGGLLAALGIAVAVALGAVVPAVPARAAGRPAAAPPAAAAPSPAVTLLGQSTTVSSGHDFSLQLAVPAAARAGDSLQVTVYPLLFARSYFDEAAQGHPAGGEIYTSGPVPLRDTPGHGTSVDLTLPVNRAAKGKDLPEFYLGATGAGVYPLQVQLLSPSGSVGTPLTTFLVYSPPVTGTRKLAFSLTVPVGAAPRLGRDDMAGPPAAAAGAALARLAHVLASFPGVPLSLDVTPETLVALDSGPVRDQATVRTLAGVVSHGDELLPAPYVRTSLPGLDAVGLQSQIEAQLDSGNAILRRLLGRAPDGGTWVSDSPLDQSTLQLLAARGLRRLILPDGDLSALPAALQTTTYAHPTTVADGSGRRGPAVVGADPILSSRLTQAGNPVLAAEQLLAELAMIQTESPSSARGVAVVVPRGRTVPLPLLTTLLAGLRHDPLVRAVTASNLFPSASAGTAASPPAAPPVRRLTGRVPDTFPDAAGLGSTTSRLLSVKTVVPTDTTLLADARSQLLLAASDQLSGRDRAALLQAANRSLGGVESKIRVVGATSVTLTSRNARLPLTIDSLAKIPVHVDLLLDSSKLTFEPYRPPQGRCSVRAQTLEECQLVLTANENVLRLPVQARTTGVFPLDMSLQSPDAVLVLTTARVTVRSTAVSFVGWLLIFGAGLFLVIWWVRDIRRGRRARQLVRRPDDPEEPGGTEEAAAPGEVPTPDGAARLAFAGARGKRPAAAGPAFRHSTTWRVSPSPAATGPRFGPGPGRHPEERPT